MADTTPKTGRWVKRLLIASLALNLLVVGAVVGAVAKGGGKLGMARFDLTVGPMTRAMEPSRRDAVRDALHDSGAFRPSSRREMRQDMDLLIAALRADTFDKGAFLDVLSRQRARLQAGQNAVIEAVADEVEGMTLDERAAFADRLQDQLRRRPGARPGDAPSGG